MDRNRKIVVSILVLMVLSSVLIIIDISLTLQGIKRDVYRIQAPGIGPGVGVIRIYGPIMVADEGGPLGLARGSDALLDRLSQLESDSRIRAIVVRINSPGGTVAATQEIYNKLMKLRKKNVVLVASMGELAASGGYYIASACNYIYANYGTITGSIGVIAMSPNLRGLFEKLGIRMNVIKSGRYKDMLASYKDISPEERQLIQELIDSAYDKFVKDVSLGRNMPIAEIEPYADGRVFNGSSALKYKLVDDLGSMEDAIAKARQMAKLPDDSPVYDEMKSPFERLLMSVSAMIRPAAAFDESVLRPYPAVEYRYQP